MSPVIDSDRIGASQHVVQFYARDADLVARAGSYLSDAVQTGAVAVVIATESHRRAFEGHLREAGVDVTAARDDGTLICLDAAALMARFLRGGRVDADAFFAVVGAIVRAAAATGRPVRAFGEMVTLLWDAGDVMAAIDVETLWNELATEVRFSLYCAYHSASVAGREHADALQRVCHLHSAVLSAPVELTWHFGADRLAPGDARRLLTGALRRLGHRDGLLADAQLVVTELATNAVLHARSPFSVSLHSQDSTVRIIVRDESQAMPAIRHPSSTEPSGRGMRLVAMLASRWGTNRMADGKVVWAELARRVA